MGFFPFCFVYKSETTASHSGQAAESKTEHVRGSKKPAGRYGKEKRMKSIEELYQEVLGSEELKKEFAQAVQENRVEDFLKENGCKAGKQELETFLKELQEKEGELSEDELDAVAGGCNKQDAALSAYTFGLGCLGRVIQSALNGGSSNEKGDSVLCNIACRRYFGAKTIWYLHSHFVWAKLLLSILDLPCFYICGLQTYFYSSTGVLKSKEIPSPCIAGGSFLL